MLCSLGILVLMLVMQTHGQGRRMSDAHILTSSYSQVSHSGSARTLGQTPWTHSSDARVVKGQHLRKITPHKYLEDGKGEVIERFNPRPWFAYEDKGKPNDELAVPFQSFPLSLPPKDKPNETNNKNTYDSPFNSYNPQIQSTKMPSNFVTPSKDSEPNKESNEDETMDSDFHEPEGPVAVPYKDHPSENHSGSIPDYLDHNPMEDQKDHPVSDHHSPPEYLDHNPMKPPKEHPNHHPALPQYLDHNPMDHPIEHHPASLPEYLDHNPVGHDYSFHHDFHDHPPVYYEIKTTTEAPEKQRLNKRPYSYYYIGRKLWYIPLYFSVYFIIYIFVLILKSIARHKITFNHYFEEDKREMKDMHEAHEEHVQQVEHHVFDDIMTAKRKYIM